MSGPKTTVWTLEPHTRAKHLILQRYLHAWLPIISLGRGKALFIDGFAGPGVYAGGEAGSPVIALRAFIDHRHRNKIGSDVHFLFFEANKARAESLAGIVDGLRPELPEGSTATVMHGEYAQLLTQALDELEGQGKQLAPSLVFVDPFGVSGLPMQLVRRVLATRSCEVLVNFMTGYAHRFIGAPEFERHLDETLGTPAWREGRELIGHDRIDFLRRLYISELTGETAGRARYVRGFSMLDERNRPIYDLVFATNHALGIDKMKDALWHVDAAGGARFSDATDPEQPTLLDGTAGADDRLVARLRHVFAGRTVMWGDVEEAIRRSPFRILRKPLKKAAADASSGMRIDSPGRAIGPLTRFTFD